MRTLSDREIPAPPPIRATSNRLAKADLLRKRTWLVEQARAEAQARKDHYVEGLFRALDPQNFSPADGASCCLYLFGVEYPEFDANTGELLPSR